MIYGCKHNWILHVFIMKTLWWYTSLDKKKIKQEISKVIKIGRIDTANYCRLFEKKIEKFLKVKHVITVSSGSMANVLVFMALGLKNKDEIIIPNIGWISIINTCKILGLKPVLVEVDPKRPLLSVSEIEKNITKKTKVIFPIYMNGRVIEIDKIKQIAKRNKIYLIEDAAQAFGVKYKNSFVGTFGDAGIFSTSITKVFTTGLGGFISTNNSRLAKVILSMRRHGFSDIQNIKNWNKYGGNFKFSDVHAAIGMVQLKKYNKDLENNLKNFNLFKNLLKKSHKFIYPANIKPNFGDRPVYNEFLSDNRAKIVKFLKTKNIETRLYSPSFDKVRYLKFKKRNKTFKNSSNFEKKVFYLPSGPGLKSSLIRKVSKLINNFYEK